MEIITVTSYTASDGRTFTDEQEAEEHQTCLNFNTWYTKMSSRGKIDSHIAGLDPQILLGWIQKNDSTVTAFICKDLDYQTHAIEVLEQEETDDE